MLSFAAGAGRVVEVRRVHGYWGQEVAAVHGFRGCCPSRILEGECTQIGCGTYHGFRNGGCEGGAYLSERKGRWVVGLFFSGLLPRQEK